MWQHRWAVWSGVLGATASCLAKVALSTDSHAPLQWIEEQYCQPYQVELDEIFYRYSYRILGDLLIHHRINLMSYFQWYRRTILEAPALALHIFEVDWCKSMLWGPRVLTFIGMLLLNAYMLGAFVKGMQESGSVIGTAITTAANFVISALWGALLWKERFAPSWWLGFACVLSGVLLLSSVEQASAQDDDRKSSTSSPGVRFKNGHTAPNSVARKYGAAMSMTKSNSTPSYQPQPRQSVTKLESYNRFSGSHSSVTSVGSPSSALPTKVSSPRKVQVKLNVKRVKQLKKSITRLEDRSFSYDCPLCEEKLFDSSTGEAQVAVADMSPSCFHMMHARCLKYQQNIAKQTKDKSASCCPICEKTIPMFMSSKQIAHFPSFWVRRVETCLKSLGPLPNHKPQPAEAVRAYLRQDPSLNETQKRYIDDDPNGLGKGLAAALAWGGSIDYNVEVQKGHRGWNQCLQTRGIWKYDRKTDTVWLWNWGDVHPFQRCEQCQMAPNTQAVNALNIPCPNCQGSSEAAHYCSEVCFKRDKQRHKMSCQLWAKHGAFAN